jgi:hypothetical protein
MYMHDASSIVEQMAIADAKRISSFLSISSSFRFRLFETFYLVKVDALDTRCY